MNASISVNNRVEITARYFPPSDNLPDQFVALRFDNANGGSASVCMSVAQARDVIRELENALMNGEPK